MLYCDITELSPGDRLERTVFTKAGNMLLPAGEVLSESSIALLKNWEIPKVAVERAPTKFAQNNNPAPPEDVMRKARENTLCRFSQIPLEDDFTRELFELAVERQGRFLLSRPGNTSANDAAPSSGFHTPKPEPAGMEAVLSSSFKLGTLPIIFHQLVETIDNPYASTGDIAHIISTDPAFAAKLLKLVNSPFYGPPSRVDTISRAVQLVGTGQLVMLAMGATLITAFKGIPVSLISMQSFWGHSVACSAAARLLAQQAGLPQPEKYFTAGLLHDIARLLIYTQLPTHALYLLTEAKRQKVTVHSLEPDTLGFTHEELGGALLDDWRCPEELAQQIRVHHDPLQPTSTSAEAILPLANTLAHAMGYGTSAETLVPPPDAQAWPLLQLTPLRLREICLQMESLVREIRSLLTSGDEL